jgi:demethylmenaquinone methyltransferase / 2-methoxy-6-polyprenyl-1,4-benzoquinol methylase
MSSDRTGRISAPEELARELFAPLGPTYDRYARLLSFGQDGRCRRFLVSRVPASGDSVVLDVATGTGAVAIELVRATGCSVVGLDQSESMLTEGRRRIAAAGLSGRIELVEASAGELPFDDAAFDHLTFTHVLRYVSSPATVLAELVRVVRPGGTVAMLEFAVPRKAPARVAWEAWVRLGLPAAGRLISPGWRRVGEFLGPSIRGFAADFPPERLLGLFSAAGLIDVEHRLLSLGGGLVLWSRRG